ncbi:MAG: zf-HC2 domain-containing protein [Chloroflexota bacterium]
MASNNISSRDAELLSAYIDNELSLEQRAALEVRMDRKPNLAQELAELQEVAELVRTLPPLTAPRNFTLTADMLAEREQERAAAATVLIFPTTALFSALTAAAATILIIFGALTLLVSSDQVETAADVAFESTQMPFNAGPPAQAQQQAAPTSTAQPTQPPSPLPEVAEEVQAESLDDASAELIETQNAFMAATALMVPADDAQMTATQLALGQSNFGNGIVIATGLPSTPSALPQTGIAAGGDGMADTDTSAADLQPPAPESNAIAQDDATFTDERDSEVPEDEPRIVGATIATEEAAGEMLELAEAEEESAMDEVAQAPTATRTPFPTLMPPPTQTPDASLRSIPLSTATVIARLVPQPTQIAAPPAAPSQTTAREQQPDVDVTALAAGIALVVGGALLVVAIVTTAARRRRRGRG